MTIEERQGGEMIERRARLSPRDYITIVIAAVANILIVGGGIIALNSTVAVQGEQIRSNRKSLDEMRTDIGRRLERIESHVYE